MNAALQMIVSSHIGPSGMANAATVQAACEDAVRQFAADLAAQGVKVTLHYVQGCVEHWIDHGTCP